MALRPRWSAPRVVITASYNFPYTITAGTVTMLASARPFNSTTGIVTVPAVMVYGKL